MKSILLKIISTITAYCLVVVSVGAARPVLRKRKTVVVPTVTAAHWPLNSSPDLEPLIESQKVINTATLEEFSNEYWTWIWLHRELVKFNQDFQTTPLDLPPKEAADVRDHYRLLELNDQSTYIFWFNSSILNTISFAYGSYDHYAEVQVCQIGGGSRKQCWSGEIDEDNMHLRGGVLNLVQLQPKPFIW